MQFWIGVENFAKIESAKICVDNYTLLVGQNNSGKTFLMQLIQGLSKKIIDLIEDDMETRVLHTNDQNCKKYVLNNQNINEVIQYINEKLELKKEEIVKEIFGKAIAIEKLYVDIFLDEEIVYEMRRFGNKNKENLNYVYDVIYKQHFENIKPISNFLKDASDNTIITVVNQRNIRTDEVKLVSLAISMSDYANDPLKQFLSPILEKNSLFLPASRTGLLLLYREFFANRTDESLSFVMQDDKIIKKEENYAGFTQPMYEFLRFLQTYSEDESQKKLYSEEISFFENNVIEGHIDVNKQGSITYNSKFDNEGVPMYLASSMINEVAPLALALTNDRRYERLIIDEVEASLHPEKQLELVRFLNRLNNKGIQLLVSTHSDTFVSKLNNLYVMSKAIQKNTDHTKLKNFGLAKEDLINPRGIFVYEFINQPNGKSIVKEVNSDPHLGYQFDLFTKSAMKIYDEASKLGDIINDRC